MSPEHVERVFEAARQRAVAELERRRDEVQRAGVRARVVTRHGPAWREFVDVVTAERADLAVMGTHGRGGLDRTLLGSVADRVVRRAPCPVLTVREPPA
jgi:nucleotide-binding universal stress UspA family protein